MSQPFGPRNDRVFHAFRTKIDAYCVKMYVIVSRSLPQCAALHRPAKSESHLLLSSFRLVISRQAQAKTLTMPNRLHTIGADTMIQKPSSKFPTVCEA